MEVQDGESTLRNPILDHHTHFFLRAACFPLQEIAVEQELHVKLLSIEILIFSWIPNWVWFQR